MNIRSVLVNVDLDAAKSSALDYAVDLATKFEAELIGVAAEQPNLTFAGIDGGAAVDMYSLEHAEIEKRLDAAHAQFNAKIPKGMIAHWRAYFDSSSRSLLENATSADVIVTSSTATAAFDGQEAVNLGELVLASGRPVIDVGSASRAAKFDTVVVGWKNTREARRAVADALPFLKRAKTVMAITVSEGDPDYEQDQLAQLAGWLARHGVSAATELKSNKEGFIDVLESAARAAEADLVVAGGYGHSRMREWLFGGVTRNLLKANTLNRLFSN